MAELNNQNPLTETGGTNNAAGGGGGDALMQDIQQATEMLKAQRDEIQSNGNLEACLKHIIGQVQDYSKALNDIKLNEKAWKKRTIFTLTSEVMRVADGNLITPNFSFHAKSEQTVFIYTGLVWTAFPSTQSFYDFIKACCEKIGLAETELADTKFMESVYEQVAHRVAHELKQTIPFNEQWVNFQNGVLVIKRDGTMEFRVHRRDDNFTYVLPFSYDPDAECPLWHKFLDEVLEQGPQHDIAEFLGYCLTTGIKAEKILAFYGLGSNGKSVIMDTVKKLFGIENISEMDMGELSDDAEKRVQIENKRLNISMESSGDINFANMKRLASCEPIDARELYHGTRMISNYAKMLVSYNILPHAEATHGWFRRWILVHFKNIIPDEKQDTELADKLEVELPGIFNWVLEAMKTFLQRRKFNVCQECRDALKRYMQSSNSAMLYLSEECEVTDLWELSGQELYKEYKTYCYDNTLKPFGRNKFYDMIEAAGVKRFTQQNKPWFHIRLTKDDEKPFL